MKKFQFSIPYPDSSIFRCDVYEDGVFMYHREVHVYDKNASIEMNTVILARKMADTLGVDQREIETDIRITLATQY